MFESSSLSFKNSSTIENFSIKFPKSQSFSASNKDKSAKINTHPLYSMWQSEKKKQKKRQEKWKRRREIKRWKYRTWFTRNSTITTRIRVALCYVPMKYRKSRGSLLRVWEVFIGGRFDQTLSFFSSPSLELPPPTPPDSTSHSRYKVPPGHQILLAPASRGLALCF